MTLVWAREAHPRCGAVLATAIKALYVHVRPGRRQSVSRTLHYLSSGGLWLIVTAVRWTEPTFHPIETYVVTYATSSLITAVNEDSCSCANRCHLPSAQPTHIDLGQLQLYMPPFRLQCFTFFQIFTVKCGICLTVGDYSATSNNMKLLHWSLMGGVLHLV